MTLHPGRQRPSFGPARMVCFIPSSFHQPRHVVAVCAMLTASLSYFQDERYTKPGQHSPQWLDTALGKEVPKFPSNSPTKQVGNFGMFPVTLVVYSRCLMCHQFMIQFILAPSLTMSWHLECVVWPLKMTTCKTSASRTETKVLFRTSVRHHLKDVRHTIPFHNRIYRVPIIQVCATYNCSVIGC